jgi:membrane protein YqaA with SNARE-associated domain
MIGWPAGPWALLACFGLSFGSALMPWLNGEALLLAFSATARSWSDLASLVVATTAGQMLGKCVLFVLARGASQRFVRGHDDRVERWRRRIGDSSPAALAIVFVSSAVSVPPFYVVTMLAGASGMRFGGFVAAGALGRLVRFAALVSVSRLVVTTLW